MIAQIVFRRTGELTQLTPYRVCGRVRITNHTEEVEVYIIGTALGIVGAGALAFAAGSGSVVAAIIGNALTIVGMVVIMGWGIIKAIKEK